MSQTVEAEYKRSEEQAAESNTRKSPEDKLSIVDTEFSDEYEELTMSHRYDQLIKNTGTELTTATVLGVESVGSSSITLLLEANSREKTIRFFSEDSYRQPKITDLVSITDANQFRDMAGEEITMFPSERPEVSGCSGLKERITRKVRVTTIRLGLGGVVMSEHPYFEPGTLTPTARGMGVLSSAAILSGIPLFNTGLLLTDSTVLSVVLFGIMFAVFVSSLSLASIYGSLATLYVALGSEQ